MDYFKVDQNPVFVWEGNDLENLILLLLALRNFECTSGVIGILCLYMFVASIYRMQKDDFLFFFFQINLSS